MENRIITKAACNADTMIEICSGAKEKWESGLSFSAASRNEMIRFFEEYYKVKMGRKRITKTEREFFDDIAETILIV